MPQQVQMAPRQASRLARHLYRGLHDPNGILEINNRLYRALGNHPWVGMIIEKRITQVMSYCQPPKYRGAKGLRIKLRNDLPMTPELEAREAEISGIVLKGGTVYPRPADGCLGAWAGDGVTKADPLPVAAAKIVRDSLLMDSAGIRIEAGTDRKLFPVTWWRAEDGARIRKAEPKFFHDSYRPDLKYPEWVVLDRDGGYKWVLSWDEFSSFIRRPDTSEEGAGLGRPELAGALDVLTGLVTAHKYNVGMFTEWKLPMGFLEIGDCDQNAVDEFIEDLEMMVGGGGGFWSAVPYISKPVGYEGKEFVKWIDLAKKPTDIQYRDFMLLSFNMLCGLFKISAEEVGFPTFDSGRATLNENSPEAMLEHSKDTGFIPLMSQFCRFLNDAIVSKFDGGIWELVFEGLDEQDAQAEGELRLGRLNSGITSVEQEQLWADLPVRRRPIDDRLWAKTQAALCNSNPKLLQEVDRLYHITERLYLAQGGLFDATTQFGLTSLMSQEHGQAMMRQQQEEQLQTGLGGPEEESDEIAKSLTARSRVLEVRVSADA